MQTGGKMSESHIALSAIAPLAFALTALVALVLTFQAVGIDLAKYVNAVSTRLARRRQEGNQRA